MPIAAWGMLALSLTSGAAFAGPPASVVTVTAEDTGDPGVTECNDGVLQGVRRFHFHRDGPAAEAPTVEFTLGGSGVEGSDYEAIEHSVTFEPFTRDAIVEIEPIHKQTDNGHFVTVVLTLVDGADYDVGEPARATGQFVAKRDPVLPPVDCNPGFQLLDVASNRFQRIEIGDVPVPIATTNSPDEVLLSLQGGVLPDGVRTGTQEDYGRFVGAATRVGTTTATVRVCPLAISFTCRTTDLTVEVVPAAPELPRTGASPHAGDLVATGAGLILLGAGLLMVRRSLSF